MKMKVDGAAEDKYAWKTLGKQESFINWGNYSRLYRAYDCKIVMFHRDTSVKVFRDNHPVTIW